VQPFVHEVAQVSRQLGKIGLEGVRDWRAHRPQQQERHQHEQRQKHRQEPRPPRPWQRPGSTDQRPTDDSSRHDDIVGQRFDVPIKDEDVAQHQAMDDSPHRSGLIFFEGRGLDVVGELGEHVQRLHDEGPLRRHRLDLRRRRGAQPLDMPAQDVKIHHAQPRRGDLRRGNASMGLVMSHEGARDEAALGEQHLGGNNARRSHVGTVAPLEASIAATAPRRFDATSLLRVLPLSASTAIDAREATRSSSLTRDPPCTAAFRGTSSSLVVSRC
jgi:hypothetical protein